ncbi:MFS transporter [Lacihabitans sp. LS3-19]|uniref:MFS transporter n=1 Tax=Lacihabitans sp. LS3-19 TaxID=2487335 RepID=UPI0020CE3404|nr:MFS transporter [Lacihabitans sp. LS3-19]MCP9770401.1 MFS transporter [Lacihabitans sp. LS3-19]
MNHFKLKNSPYLIVTVAALGYFVDAYDLILFVVIRKASLISIGVPNADLGAIGLSLFNVQMIGTFLGGIFFGIIGDKKGRLSILFGSILVYSIANLLNAAVDSLWQYYVLRFIAGFGLAGELGAGITLVSETMPQKKRGYGTAIVAAAGASGAFFAGIVGDLTPWRVSYIIGGTMGLLLLFLRFNTFESKMFENVQNKKITKGNFLSLLSEKSKLRKYLSSILISLPIFFTITILMQLAPEVAQNLGITAEIKAGTAVTLVYLGLTIGDLSSGLISQYFKNRLKTIRFFLILGFVITVFHLLTKNISLQVLYVSYVLLGFGAGYWVNLLTLAAEQFGTNIRATVATTIPNFARGAVVPISFLYAFLLSKNEGNVSVSALYTGFFCFIVAFISTYFIKDTFSKDLDYTE